MRTLREIMQRQDAARAEMRAINEDALRPDQRPAAGARITLRLDLDVIFGEAERALLDEPRPGRTEEEILGLPDADG